MNPASDDLTYLAEINAAIYAGMTVADPQAIWVTYCIAKFNAYLILVFKRN